MALPGFQRLEPALAKKFHTKDDENRQMPFIPTWQMAMQSRVVQRRAQTLAAVAAGFALGQWPPLWAWGAGLALLLVVAAVFQLQSIRLDGMARSKVLEAERGMRVLDLPEDEEVPPATTTESESESAEIRA